MKIAFLSFYSGQVDRGLETFVRELTTRLSETNDVTLFQAGEKTVPAAPRLQQMVVPLAVDWSRPNVHLDGRADLSLGKRLYLNYWALRIKSFTQKVLAQLPNDTEVVVATNCGWQTLLTKIWCVRHGKKLVIPGQSGPGWDDRINLLLRPDAFVALTGHQESWAKRNAFGCRVALIPNGVDLSRFNQKVKPAPLDLKKPVVLCVAALEKNKRVDLTMKAVAKTKASLLVLGSGDLHAELVSLGEKILPGRFKIASVPHDQTPGHYSACDLFTMAPIQAESFGIVFLEAMATNKPVVAPNDPIRAEIVGDGGLLVDVEDIDIYAKALETALAKNWADQPVVQAKKFSWQAAAESYNRLFDSL